jgi:hypothetical protein
MPHYHMPETAYETSEHGAIGNGLRCDQSSSTCLPHINWIQ